MYPQGIGQLSSPQQMPQPQQMAPQPPPQPAPPQPAPPPSQQVPEHLSGIGLNLVQTQEKLKDLSDSQLTQYLKQGSGGPPVLVLAELNRRKRTRDGAAQKPQATVADEILMQSGIGAMAPQRAGLADGGVAQRVPFSGVHTRGGPPLASEFAPTPAPAGVPSLTKLIYDAIASAAADRRYNLMQAQQQALADPQQVPRFIDLVKDAVADKMLDMPDVNAQLRAMNVATSDFLDSVAATAAKMTELAPDITREQLRAVQAPEMLYNFAPHMQGDAPARSVNPPSARPPESPYAGTRVLAELGRVQPPEPRSAAAARDFESGRQTVGVFPQTRRPADIGVLGRSWPETRRSTDYDDLPIPEVLPPTSQNSEYAARWAPQVPSTSSRGYSGYVRPPSVSMSPHSEPRDPDPDMTAAWVQPPPVNFTGLDMPAVLPPTRQNSEYAARWSNLPKARAPSALPPSVADGARIGITGVRTRGQVPDIPPALREDPRRTDSLNALRAEAETMASTESRRGISDAEFNYLRDQFAYRRPAAPPALPDHETLERELRGLSERGTIRDWALGLQDELSSARGVGETAGTAIRGAAAAVPAIAVAGWENASDYTAPVLEGLGGFWRGLRGQQSGYQPTASTPPPAASTAPPDESVPPDEIASVDTPPAATPPVERPAPPVERPTPPPAAERRGIAAALPPPLRTASITPPEPLAERESVARVAQEALASVPGVEEAEAKRFAEEFERGRRSGINMPLLVTGLSLMATQRPDFLGAVGEAGIAGLSTHMREREQAAENQFKQFEMQARARASDRDESHRQWSRDSKEDEFRRDDEWRRLTHDMDWAKHADTMDFRNRQLELQRQLATERWDNMLALANARNSGRSSISAQNVSALKGFLETQAEANSLDLTDVIRFAGMNSQERNAYLNARTTTAADAARLNDVLTRLEPHANRFTQMQLLLAYMAGGTGGIDSLGGGADDAYGDFEFVGSVPGG
jgi:hypothetical protein